MVSRKLSAGISNSHMQFEQIPIIIIYKYIDIQYNILYIGI